MRAGQLRRRLTFQRNDPIDDGGAGSTDNWVDVFTTWGGVRGLSSRERIVAMQTEGEVTHEIRVRYRTDIDPAYRVVDGTAVYDIDPPVDPDGRRRELVMTAREAR